MPPQLQYKEERWNDDGSLSSTLYYYKKNITQKQLQRLTDSLCRFGGVKPSIIYYENYTVIEKKERPVNKEDVLETAQDVIDDLCNGF